VHPDFHGWLSNDPLPRDKAGETKWATYFVKYNESLEQELKPVAINIHDNFAFVHYYYTVAYKDAEGKHKMEKGRWTDVYMEDGDKWLLICDHGGPTSVE
jgi:ketosteroid isomerase-like protein